MEYIPATPVAVKLRPIALVVVDMDPTPRIAVSVCVAVRTTDDAEFNLHQVPPNTQRFDKPDPDIEREEGIVQSENQFEYPQFSPLERDLTGARVQTACIGSLIIHAFYNVDFAL